MIALSLNGKRKATETFYITLCLEMDIRQRDSSDARGIKTPSLESSKCHTKIDALIKIKIVTN